MGLYLVVGRFVVRAIVSRRTRYVVTDRRVLVIGGMSGTRTTSAYLRSLPPPIVTSGRTDRAASPSVRSLVSGIRLATGCPCCGISRRFVKSAIWWRGCRRRGVSLPGCDQAYFVGEALPHTFKLISRESEDHESCNLAICDVWDAMRLASSKVGPGGLVADFW